MIAAYAGASIRATRVSTRRMRLRSGGPSILILGMVAPRLPIPSPKTIPQMIRAKCWWKEAHFRRRGVGPRRINFRANLQRQACARYPAGALDVRAPIVRSLRPRPIVLACLELLRILSARWHNQPRPWKGFPSRDALSRWLDFLS